MTPSGIEPGCHRTT